MKLQFSVKKATLYSLATFLAYFCIALPAHAQAVVVNTNLSFGKFVMVDNAAPRQIELLAGGGYNADPQYIFFNTPSLGNATASGFTPGATLIVTVGTTDLDPMGGGSANFTTSATFTDPAIVMADGSGEATFDVGATLTSDGGGVMHTNDDYDGIFTVMVTE